MRKMKLLVLPLLLALIAGCGRGGGGSSQPQHAPTISNLQYTPQSATLNQDGGLINVTGTLDFNDIDGNLSTLTINIYDSNGTPLAPLQRARYKAHLASLPEPLALSSQ
jgi:hypothetical protein